MMEVRSEGPLRVASIVWRLPAGGQVLTVVAKATYLMAPGEAQLAPDQESLNEDDNHWDDDPSRSLYSPTDLVPRKPRADILLVGSAFAPRGEPVRSLHARLIVGDVDKTIEVIADRVFTREGQLREGARFLKMPLRWERAAAGPGNPVGMRLDGPMDRYGQIAVPNLQPIGLNVQRAGDFIPPVGFGPLAPSWPERRDRLGRHRETWSHRDWATRPLPDDIDRAYFSAAPRDQQTDSLRDNERLILENLHPEHPRLVTALPGLRPRVFVERPGSVAREVESRADTLWIDTNRFLCTLVWRVQVRIEGPSDVGLIRVVAEQRRMGPSLSTSLDDASQTIAPVLRDTRVLPFGGSSLPDGPDPTMPLAVGDAGDVEEISADLAPDDTSRYYADASGHTLPLGDLVAKAGLVMPFGKQPPPSTPLPAAPPSPAPPAVAERPPQSAPQQPSFPLPPPVAPSAKASPWAAGEARAPQPTVGESAAAASASPNVMSAREGPLAHNALSLSNAAAGQEQKAPLPPPEAPKPVDEIKPRARPKEVIKLLWFDPKAVTRIRKHAEWRVTLAELSLRRLEEGMDDEDEEDGDAASNGPKPAEKRDVLEVIVKGGATGADGIKLALDEAIGEDGQFEPPLVLMAGELELSFDEVAIMKATAAAAAPFAGGDKRLADVLAGVEELEKTPWLNGAGPVAERLTDQLKEALSPVKRGLPADYLEATTERMLLEQRSYKTRTVAGKKWIRASLRGTSGLPVYIPEVLREELPLYRRLKVRMIGEVDLPEDQYEQGSAAVKVVALGRVMG